VVEGSATLLGETLRAKRMLQEKTLKAVADRAEISTAYLLKLEKGQVESPSPHILHRLAGELGLDYLGLMRDAGYVIPDDVAVPAGGTLAHALSSEELTDDEARAVAAFLRMYRAGELR